MDSEITRRTFLKAAAATSVVAGAGLAVAGFAVASDGSASGSTASTSGSASGSAASASDSAASASVSASASAPVASASASASASGSYLITPVASYTCDVCVMGAGNSGLAAAVQALQNGMSVIVLEKTGGTGGGGRGTEGFFGVGSQMQKDLGIEINPADVISREMEYHHNRVDGLKWLDLIKASGDNIGWLQDCGVQFTGTVDNYHGGEFETFHWLGENRAAHDFAPQMTAKVEELGGQFLLNTPGTMLLLDESGNVTGIIGQKANGDYILVNAGAVILASGGFANNNDYLAKGHFSNVENVVRFLYGFNGDGLTLAKAAGGADTLDRFSGLFQLTVSGAPGGEYGTFGSGDGLVVGSHSGNNIWIQETGERYCAENSGDENWMALMTPTQVHEDFFSIFNRDTFNTNVQNIAFPKYTYDESMDEIDKRFADNPYGDAFTADTIEDLAAQVEAASPNIKAETFVETVNHYNEMCAAGVDSDFGKPAEYMVAMTEPPFYCIRQIQTCMVTFGGIKVNRKMEVINDAWEPIPGLYATGVDSADLWPNVYTINVPGGTNANNINSGRTAANAALEYIGDAVTGTISSDGDTSASVVPYYSEVPTTWKDGTYTSTMPGMFGNITATVTISGGKITDITETNELETSYIGVVAMDETLIPAMIEAQTCNVDTVSGATMSSNGIRNAVADCLDQAGK